MNATPLESGTAERAKLKSASVNGVAVNFGSQITRFGLNFLYQVLIARLLLPADFGVVAMAAPVLAFVSLFADFGLTQATVQRPNITQDQLSLIYWINLLMSLSLAVITIIASPLVGAFYGNARVVPVVAALGANFLIGGLYGQHLALLNRRLAFTTLALIDLVSFAAGAIAGVTAAVYGFRYWSIIINQVTNGLVTVIMALAFSRWRPSRPRWAEDGRALLGFGGNITTFNLVNYFARNLDNVLIGKFVGAAGLGLYDRAYKLLLMPLSQITGPFAKVANPLLARLVAEPAAYRRAYLRLLETICLLTYPGVAFAMVSTPLLIHTVLGARWDGVAPIFRVLAIGAFFAPISNSTGWLFITQNRTAEMRNWGMVSSALFAASFVIGLHWGVQGVANCYIAVGCFQGPMLWWGVTRRGPLSLGQLLGALSPYALALGVTIAVEAALYRALPSTPAMLLVMGAAAYPTFLFGMLLSPMGRVAMGEVWKELTKLADRLRTKRGKLASA